jgi:HEAT repeat protein
LETPTIDALTARAAKTAHGFKDLERAAEEIFAQHPSDQARSIAMALLASDLAQARCIGTFLLGHLAPTSPADLAVLKAKVSQDEDWRVQEILAKAFDGYCAQIGYENALPTIKDWLADAAPNVCRAVTEGLRIWTGRPYFRDHPETAIQLLARFRDHDSDYLRSSAGNALRDISKKHPQLVAAELATWDLTRPKTRQTHKLANRFLQKP